MRERRSLTLAIVSIGVSFILENLARFIWGNEIRGYKVPVLRGMEFWGIRVGKNRSSFCWSVSSSWFWYNFFSEPRMGKAMRAVADNPMLASVKGVDSEQVILRTSISGRRWPGPRV
jgi:branched-chain amino acid transport system permease protein/neutral amino acid transport system permease protein